LRPSRDLESRQDRCDYRRFISSKKRARSIVKRSSRQTPRRAQTTGIGCHREQRRPTSAQAKPAISWWMTPTPWENTEAHDVEIVDYH
jgi:hypothetical protein